MKFTPNQQKVIDLRHKNILVSAAAGSGKTAVLVERILGLLMDEENPVDIDRLLIVTFTNAAAGEMRERIGNAIEQKLKEQPDHVHLQRQSTLLHHAQITTIDSFCLFVIRNNFNEIGLDPGFRIADSGEIALLKQDMINEVFEELLEKEESREWFTNLLEHLAYRGKEKVLEEAVLKIYQFAQSFPWPEEWLQERYQDYEVKEEPEDTPWGILWMAEIGQRLDQMTESLQLALEVCQEPDGPHMYTEALQSDLELVELLRHKNYGEQFEIIKKLSFARLSSKKDTSVSQEKKVQVKAIRDENKERLQSLAKEFFCFSKETIKQQMAETKLVEKALLDTVMAFKERFEAAKRAKNLLDFNDMEHFALEILVERKKKEDTGEMFWQPTKTAMEYGSYFQEIMIDEYQDSNLVQEYLLQSISGETQNRHNRFMVGDLKQSIYKFRLARPEIFLEKYHSYSTEDQASSQRIDLQKNFRSRYQVLDSVNHVFYQIMGETLGGIQYTEEEALYPGAAYQEGDQDYTTELLVLEEKGKDPKKAEAAMVAERILQLKGSFQVTDKETGQLRAAEYSDIVVLLRTNAGWDEEFYNVFMEHKIPACVTGKTGYFSATEVQLVLSFLKVIDNPGQDIPLYATLKSKLGRFSEEEIVQIKGMGRENLYENLKAAQEGHLGEKVIGFLETLHRYRDLVYVMPIHKLLRVYLKETGYLYYFGALPGGEQRVANVKMLLEKAEAYEKSSYFGLFHFIRYMEQLQKYDIETEGADIVDETRNVVRIMSIHKSKGLEFPICIVAGLSKKMNQQDIHSSLVCDMDLGIGMEYKNPVTRVKNKDMRRNVLAHKMKMDNLGEELRILYVAMTRAKEKLILSGIVESYEERMQSYLTVKRSKEQKLPLDILQNSSSFMDFLLPALVKEQDKIKTILWNPFEVNRKKEIGEVSEQVDRLVLEERIRAPFGEKEKEMAELLKSRFSFVYGHENLQGLYAKTSVSELKMKAMEETDVAAFQLFEEVEMVPYVPAFIEKKEEVTGTTRGNAYHRVMELLDFDKIKDQEGIWKGLAEQVEEQRLEAAYLELIRKDKLHCFLNSFLAARMKVAWEKRKLFREQPFVLGISAQRVDEKFPSEEKVLIQGIIDAYFEEDGELVVVDYKTDSVKTGAELVNRYREQMHYYEEALQQLTGKRVKEKILYSFALNEEILCD